MALTHSTTLPRRPRCLFPLVEEEGRPETWVRVRVSRVRVRVRVRIRVRVKRKDKS